MLRQIVVALLVVGLLAPVCVSAQHEAPAAKQTTPSEPAETIESLRSKLAAHIAQPRFDPAAWGIKVVSLETGKTVFEHNPQKYFSPASNAKLYTAALALDRLGPDFRVRTSLYSAAGPDAAGTL